MILPNPRYVGSEHSNARLYILCIVIALLTCLLGLSLIYHMDTVSDVRRTSMSIKVDIATPAEAQYIADNDLETLIGRISYLFMRVKPADPMDLYPSLERAVERHSVQEALSKPNDARSEPLRMRLESMPPVDPKFWTRPNIGALLGSMVVDPRRQRSESPELTVRLHFLRGLQPKVKFTSGKYDRIAVIVEPRCVKGFERIVRMIFMMLGPRDWNLHIFHGIANEGCIDAQLGKAFGDYKKHNLGIATFNVMGYNRLLKSREFWRALDATNNAAVLVFQTDTMFCREGIEEFVKYDYVGAPWLIGMKENVPPHELGGNGGTSLRNAGAALRAIRDCPDDAVYKYRAKYPEYAKRGFFRGLAFVEDLYFSHCSVILNQSVPSRNVANTFACETSCPRSVIGWQGPVAIHKFFAVSSDMCGYFIMRNYGTNESSLDAVNSLVEISLQKILGDIGDDGDTRLLPREPQHHHHRGEV